MSELGRTGSWMGKAKDPYLARDPQFLGLAFQISDCEKRPGSRRSDPLKSQTVASAEIQVASPTHTAITPGTLIITCTETPSSSGSATKTYRDRQAPTLSQITQEASAAGGFQPSSSYIFSFPLKPLSLTSGLSTCSSTFLVCPGLLMLHNTREVGTSFR